MSVVAGRKSEARVLFGPYRDYVRAFLNRPFFIAVWNDGEAGTLGMLPDRAKALRIELPRAVVFVAGLRERLTGHLPARRKGHFELRVAGRRGGGERLAVDAGCLDVARRHRLQSEGRARGKEHACDGQ